jgi:3',5'-nucleoside bisphosphate phosphatase
MLRTFRCDLHIHTCLSPCADLDMYPRAVVDRAVQQALDVIAICDHNSSENVAYVRKAAAARPLAVLAGMEITSREEVHMLALFDDLNQLERLQKLIYEHLPGKNDEKAFGCQVIVNGEDEVEGFNERLLIGAAQLGLVELIAAVHGLGGLAIASHIDRPSFSVLSQLGFIGSDMPFDALEVTRRLGIRSARQRYPELSSFPLVESSDAHFLDDIGSAATRISMEEATTGELKLAFAGRGGRGIHA